MAKYRVLKHSVLKSRVLKHKWLLLVLLWQLLSGCGKQPLLVISGETMGTTYTVKVVGGVDVQGFDQGFDKESLGARLDSELKRLNGLMSTYDPTSELSRFNQAGVSELFPVSSEVLEVLQFSKIIHEQSHGAFDVTVGPLVNLWGFGPDPSQDAVPSDEAISLAMARTGFRFLKPGNGTLRKEVDLYVDLSAIAKGYAVDRLAKILDEAKISHYLVEVGGELRAKGRNERNSPWTVAVEAPVRFQRSVFRIIELGSMSMATSGDYRNYFEVDGKRYSHTIDPRTGWPISHHIASVTVLASSAVLADGYATAINVLGPQAGLALAEAQNLAVLVIIKTDDGFEERSSSALDAYMEDHGG